MYIKFVVPTPAVEGLNEPVVVKPVPVQIPPLVGLIGVNCIGVFVLQNCWSAPALTVGKLFTTTFIVDEFEQPFAFVPLTV